MLNKRTKGDCVLFLSISREQKTTLLFIVFRPGLGSGLPDQPGHTEFFFSLFFLQPGSVASLDRAEFQNYALVQGFF